jgi:cytochrome c
VLRRVLVVCAIAAFLWTGSVMPDEVEKKPFTADRHKQRGLTCAACHKEEKPKMEAPAEACLACHESIEAVAEKTVNLKPNPHKNHVTEAMDVECTQCHYSHKADDPICQRCHMGMVFEKKAAETK